VPTLLVVLLCLGAHTMARLCAGRPMLLVSTPSAMLSVRCCGKNVALSRDATSSTDPKGSHGVYYVQDQTSKATRITIDLVVIRSLKDGQMSMAKPCVRCYAAIKQLGVRYVYYSTFQGYITREKVENMDCGHVCAGQRRDEFVGVDIL
jgi:hypothetical protein